MENNVPRDSFNPIPERLKASIWTERKQDAFRDYLRVYAAIAAAIQHKWSWVGRWFYFELTAGSGFIENDNGLIKGSPLIAMEVFHEQPGFEVNCFFLEQNIGYAESLAMSLRDCWESWPEDEKKRVWPTVQRLDSCQVLNHTSPYIMPHGPMGLLYWDGLGADIYPSREIAHWLELHKRHDLLIMGSGTAQKRTGRPRFDRMLLTVPRQVWLSDTNGPWEWIFALATGWAPLADKISKDGIQLHAANSVHGREILDKLGSTRGERMERGQMKLFTNEQPYRTYEEYLKHPTYLTVRAEALHRANGKCERCGRQATEVHHLRYPPWGEFDVVENLLAVCHKCHCWIEGKET